MKDIIEKIKTAEPKTIIIYSILVLGIIISLFMFGGNDDEEPDVNTVEIEEKNKSVYATKKEALLAKYGQQETKTAYVPKEQPEDISDITDDEDLLLLQAQQQIRNSNLENRQQAQPYTPPANKAQSTPPQASNAYVPPAQQQAVISPSQTQTGEAPQAAGVPQVEPPKEPETSRFYIGRRRTQTGNTISAAVQGEQTVMNGSTIKLILLEDMPLESGVTIPKNTTIWGVCSLTKERMLVNITSILLGKDLIEIKKTAYDLDGQQGINLPANIKAELAKRAEAQSIQNAPTDEITNNGGILEKSAGAVVNTAKGLLSRKAEEIKVTVKSNYKIVLK